MLRASIEYDNLVFGLLRSRIFQKLEIIQNYAIRICLSCQIPINAFLAKVKESLLQFHFQFLAAKFFIKTLSVTDHLTAKSLFR